MSLLFQCFVQDKSQRSLDTDTAAAMLALLLGKRWSLLPQFHQFLEVAVCLFVYCMNGLL